MVEIYVNLIKKELKSINDVPASIKEKVKEKLEERA